MGSTRHTQKKSPWVGACGIAAISTLLFGYHAGIMSSVLLIIRRQLPLSPYLEGCLVAALVFGAFVGTLVAFPLVHRWGVRRSVICTAWGFLGSSILLSQVDGFTGLLVGRICSGLCIGTTALVVPLYLAEKAPKSIRGGVVAVSTLAIVIGIFCSYCVGAWITITARWHQAFLVLLIPSALQIGGISLLSPDPADQKRTHIPWKGLFKQSLRTPLFIGMLLNVLQQTTGINAFVYYAPFIFERVSARATTTYTLLPIITGGVSIIMTIVAALLVDRWGRRPLFALGMGLMSLSLGTFIWLCMFFPHMGGIVSCVIAFLAAYSISLGPLPSVLITEMYPTHTRSLCMTLCMLVNWGANALIAFSFPVLVHLFQLPFPFICYGICTVLGGVWGWYVLPETKGKPLPL